ncbi:hypothetical protein OF113_14045 [Ectopseudomonas chengduensis]|nr:MULTISPECIES: hypothetical protein [Pseudomonas]MDZ4190743.1 hypothetical protein [Pseudomonas sp.]UZT76192.1 hypothetical protein OF113_14045 [Pseudomonas chengduensis]
MRDQLYRLCEAKINGWITADHYEMLLTRNQRYTLALMAIENLAQASQAPTVTLTSQSSAESYTNFKASENLLKSAKKEKADLEKIEKDKIKPEQTARLAELEQEIPILEERVKNTKSALASGSTSANISMQGTTQKTNQEGIDAIKSITETLITQGEDGYKCYYASLDSSPNPTSAKKALNDYCEQYFKTRKELLANFINSQKDAQGKPKPLPPATILDTIKQLQ